MFGLSCLTDTLVTLHYFLLSVKRYESIGEKTMHKATTLYNAVVDGNVKQHGLTKAHDKAQQTMVTRQALAYMQGDKKEGDAYFQTMMEATAKRCK